MLDLLREFRERTRRHAFEGSVLACALCGGTDHAVVGRRDRWLHPLITVCCKTCGLVFANPMPSAEEVEAYYQRDYRQHISGIDEPDGRYLMRARKGCRERFHAIKSDMPATGRWLDVGTAAGEFLKLVKENGYEALGIEPSPSFAAFARREYGLEVMNCGWQDAPIADASLDVVTIHHVLEHLRAPMDALAAFHRWLRPGGILYVSVPNIYRPHRSPMSRFHFAHLYNFWPKTLVMAGLKAGFEPLHGRDQTETTVIFRRVEPKPADWFCFPESAAELRRHFAEHTNLRYLLSAQPHTRLPRRLYRSIRQRLAARKGAPG
ncbi:MAG: class I SAM-dependent methyltransferase [Alphaproteobacteria bacterium]|nr:class I SAM-dependent methyltransferase [Alphaproteobacteria bacterium]